MGQNMLEMLNLAILWSIALVCLTIAINARGSVRVGFSFFFTLILFSLSGFFTSVKLNSLKENFTIQPVEQVQPVVEAPAPPPLPVEPEETEEERMNREAEDNYRREALPLLNKASEIAGAIQVVNLGDLRSMTDSEYENLLNRAMALRTQANNYNRKLKTLQPTERLKSIDNDIRSGAENLRLAGFSLHKFFNAENTDEEASLRTQFKSQSSAALRKFRDAISEISQ